MESGSTAKQVADRLDRGGSFAAISVVEVVGEG
jgi:hypothetical protein